MTPEQREGHYNKVCEYYSKFFDLLENHYDKLPLAIERMEPRDRAVPQVFSRYYKKALDIGHKHKPEVSQFIFDLMKSMMIDFTAFREFKIKKSFAVVALLANQVKSYEVMAVYDSLVSQGGEIKEEFAKYQETVDLLSDLIRKKNDIPEINHILEEISDIALDTVANMCKHGMDEKSSEATVELLASLLMKRVYNAMYWYMYGKQ